MIDKFKRKQLVSCEIDQFRHRLESQFSPNFKSSLWTTRPSPFLKNSLQPTVCIASCTYYSLSLLYHLQHLLSVLHHALTTHWHYYIIYNLLSVLHHALTTHWHYYIIYNTYYLYCIILLLLIDIIISFTTPTVCIASCTYYSLTLLYHLQPTVCIASCTYYSLTLLYHLQHQLSVLHHALTTHCHYYIIYNLKNLCVIISFLQHLVMIISFTIYFNIIMSCTIYCHYYVIFNPLSLFYHFTTFCHYCVTLNVLSLLFYHSLLPLLILYNLCFHEVIYLL